jgi:TRAP-type C4-dicarboxylate transport system permease large subunit
MRIRVAGEIEGETVRAFGTAPVFMASILVPAVTSSGSARCGSGCCWWSTRIAVITPPVGLNLYTMKSVVPQLDLADVFREIAPYVAIEALLLAVLIAVPEPATAALLLPAAIGLLAARRRKAAA